MLSVFLGTQKYSQYKQSKVVETEKQKILTQIDGLQKKNKEIAASLEYFKSDSFKQRVAREQLNLKKPGETVYSFTESLAEQKNLETEEKVEKPKSNIENWVKYFTGKK